MAVRSLRRVGYKGSWVPPVKPITSSRGQSAIPSWHGRWCGSSPWEPYQRGLYSLPVGLMEKAMAPHSSTLAWKIPWTEEPGGLPSMGSQRVGHNWATSLSFFFFFYFPFTFHFPALEKEMATHSNVLVWRIPGTGSLVGCRLWGRIELDTTEAT